MAKMIRTFNEFTNSTQEKDMGSTKSRAQVWNEFNQKYTQLYGKDLFGNVAPHHKAKANRVTERIHRSEPELIKEKIEQISEVMEVKLNQKETNFLSSIITFINQIITLPSRIILWPFTMIGKLWKNDKKDSNIKPSNKTIVKKVESTHKRGYSGSYNK